MRLVCRIYDDGSRRLVQTDDEGQNLRVLSERGNAPPRTAVNRVPAFIEVSCDDRGEIGDQVRDALKELEEHLPRS
jgi:hypothetical protein